jgi:hypothetical protein
MLFGVFPMKGRGLFDLCFQAFKPILAQSRAGDKKDRILNRSNRESIRLPAKIYPAAQ